ncbi:MAG: ABC transporter substrate-binding protein [Acetobacteraceae bacterium]|nr:ABC transporter substrate-binding protein [Acetobacteraceae bacterium]
MANTLRRRTLLKASLAGAGATVLLARHGRAAAEKPQYGGKLRVAYQLAPGALDPVVGRSGGDAYYWRQFVDQLVDADPALKPRPETSLAESWDVSDPKKVMLKLRRGVLFHDDTPFNAEAVKFNIERLLDPATKATPRAAFSAVETVDAVDEHLVRINLKKPWGSVLSTLADRGGAMNSPTAVKALGADYAFKPVSTGPFKIAEFVSGSHVRFVRNEKYWGRDAAGNPLPYLDEIVVNTVKDPTVQVSALKAGEMDLIYLPYREVGNFLADKTYNVRKFDGGGIALTLQYNRAKPPMDNMNLRLAVAYAINPELINRAVFFNRAIIAKGGMWPTGAWAYDPTVKRPHYDVAKAREYLKLGGKPNGFEMDAIIWPSEVNTPMAEIIRAQLGAIGIKLNLKVYEVTVATEKFNYGGEAPIFLTSWSRYPEPDWNASLIYRSNGYYNAGKIKDDRLDALIDAGAAVADIEKRKPIYRQIDEIVLGEAHMVPMLYGVTYAAARKNLIGIDDVFGWDAKMYLHRMWLKKT